MAESKRTPGPWFCELALGDDIGPVGTRYWTIKPTTFYDDERFMDISSWISDDNARLIAAAPELLDALEDMLAGWKYIRQHHGDLYGVGWDRAEIAAEQAIAKAKGTAND